MTSWQIYWITRLDGASIACGLLWIILLMSLLFWIPVKMGVSLLGLKKYLFFHLGTFFIFLAADVLLPTTKEMAAILILPKVYSSVSANEELKKIPNNLVRLANEWIESMTKKVN